MSVTTDCNLVLIGPPSDIDAMETRLTAESEAPDDTDLDDNATWQAVRGWPASGVVRRGTPERGHALYAFDVGRVHRAAGSSAGPTIGRVLNSGPTTSSRAWKSAGLAHCRGSHPLGVAIA